MPNKSEKDLNKTFKLSQITDHGSRITLVDTHCHLDMLDDPGEVVKRAVDSGVSELITIGSDFESNRKNLSIAGQYPAVYVSVGMHPHDAKRFTDKVYGQLEEWAKWDKVVAIGETGLDYHYDHSPRDIQREVFARQLALAKDTSLPVSIHSREAKDDTLEILGQSGISRGVLHCFSGDVDMAEKAMAMGLCISIAGPVTFRNAKQLAKIAGEIPDDYLLVETDSPYLTPEPMRGRANEPAFITHTAKKLAEIRGVSFDDISRITTINARRLFGIGELPTGGEIAYRIRDNLYLNITNRCTSRCSFCARFHGDYVKGHNLRLADEPDEEQLKKVIGDPSVHKEIVFCGYGEPLLRFDLVRDLSCWIKRKGGYVRINTNGHGNLINKKNVLPELSGCVDAISISLDAQDEETYNRICKPSFDNAFREVLSFIREAKRYIPDVQATVVGVEGVDIDKCRELMDELRVMLKVRKLDSVG